MSGDSTHLQHVPCAIQAEFAEGSDARELAAASARRKAPKICGREIFGLVYRGTYVNGDQIFEWIWPPLPNPKADRQAIAIATEYLNELPFSDGNYCTLNRAQMLHLLVNVLTCGKDEIK